ncbi:cytochrome P450 [Striga asiatica]|uniref:Cytochrome P450 n=1 Tax=Striga asiatica TaxID=4170 RepID=A0A5A7Q4H6_STRAF|nr:cytochrome P450 [Striga asiatica]
MPSLSISPGPVPADTMEWRQTAEFNVERFCHCRKKVVTRTSWSDINPGRRYISCEKFKVCSSNFKTLIFLIWVKSIWVLDMFVHGTSAFLDFYSVCCNVVVMGSFAVVNNIYCNVNLGFDFN